MRISDWSSDVCSSDLFVPAPQRTSSGTSRAWAPSTPAISASTNSVESALRFSGRLSVKVQHPDSRSIFRGSFMMYLIRHLDMLQLSQHLVVMFAQFGWAAQ